MELQAITGQLYLVNGQAQTPDNGAIPGLLAQAAPPKAARSRRRDSLFVHISLTGPMEETAVLTQDLLDLISQRFFQATGSVTAALRQAIDEVNQRLLRLNLESSGPNRSGAIACAALHQGELFMLQAGEGLAFIGHNFGVERLPADKPTQSTPLGRTAGLRVRYYHHRLQEGNILLLADPRIANLTAEALAPALVDTDVEEGLLALQTAVGPQTARLLLVEFSGEEVAHLPEVASTAAPIAAATVAAAQFPAPVREGEEKKRETAVTPPTSLQADKIAADVEHGARRATASAAFGLANFTDWLTDMLSRLRPPREENEEPTNWAVPTLIAIVIPIIVAIIVTSVYLERGRVRRFAEIKMEMGQSIGLADGAATEEAARAYYDAIILLADEADELRAGDAEVYRLRQTAMAQLDRLDGVTRLQAQPIYQFSSEISLGRVTLQRDQTGGIYTLDSNSNVYFHTTDSSYQQVSGDPTLIMFSGKALGNQVAGRVADMLWRRAGTAVSRDGLTMLDTSGALLSYFPNLGDTRATPLGMASIWQTPVAMTTFAERLYVLDPGAREIWKYYPDGDAFVVRENDEILRLDPSADLHQAVDLDLYSEDGSLLLVYGDGRLRYYDTRSGRVQWDESNLLENGGLTIPMVSPIAGQLVGRGLNTSIFVADPGTGRILQIARGGRVVAQYRATNEAGLELFSNIRGFDVAESPLRIFVTDGNKLYVATP
jgi:hypothetical protein